ncbi:phytanoyl dioxygenase [Fusarium napiforme]|uniref:Phytanoyl dioxygenase n=1 Tax=Fusarium napiforme TaxID=42672 RepID=A0A8H5K5T6_9HYPO|nr:phytanoyl dioxygenase [Fusarium napiforme]
MANQVNGSAGNVTTTGLARMKSSVLPSRLLGVCQMISSDGQVTVYKAVSRVGYVEDHQNPVEFMQKEENGIGKFGPASDKLMV